MTRQVEHAKAYAARKGWTVDDRYVFVDDGVSGAEFATRRSFARLMNALKPKPKFQVLIMSEESRLGREQIEVMYALKQIVTAGVHVWFYFEDLNTLGMCAYPDSTPQSGVRDLVYPDLGLPTQARPLPHPSAPLH